MNVKRELQFDDVGRIAGKSSRELAERCPDRRISFPVEACTNLGCEYSVQEPGYFNCTFVAAEVGGSHTLEAISNMLGLTREGVRKIEQRALMKIRAAITDEPTALRESLLAPRPDHNRPNHQVADVSDKGDNLPARHGRKLG